METAIDYLTKKHDWLISSDPRTYSDYPNNYGLRNYTVNGFNYDADSGGYHRAFDVYNNKTDNVPSVTHGTVVRATKTGAFGGEVVIQDYNGYYWVYGHLQVAHIKVKKGDKIKQGHIIGLQGNSNYYNKPMDPHLHIQLLAPGSNITDGKWYVEGLQIDRYNINNGDYHPVKPKGSDNVAKNIYSKFIKAPFTAKKNSIKGVVIHNDAGSMTPSDYLPWLTNRYNNGQIELGFAVLYVNRNETLWFSPTDHAEWHTATPNGNFNFIGFEVCESMPSKTSNATFLLNEEATLKVAADVMKSFNLTPSRSTVKLHNEFSQTACPHRSWAIHLGNVPYTQANKNKLKDYFIGRIKHYMGNGAGSTPKPTAPSKPSTGTSSGKYPKATMGTFKTNSLGIQWAPATGVWINGNQPIEKRHGSPRRLKNNSAGMMKAGQRLDYREIARSDGHIWLLDYKSDQWVPVKTWNSVTGAVGADWGSWK